MISVIVPCFNSENTIERCLESIVNQTYRNIEILVIDDGSTDATGMIVKKYASRDKRIKYFYKINEGVSKARNLGIKKSTGLYIMFIDSDDFIDYTMLEKLKEGFNIENSKLSICSWSRSEITVDKNEVDLNRSLNKNEILTSILTDNKIRGYLWNKMFLAKTIYEKNLNLDENIHFMEDFLFCFQYVISLDETDTCVFRDEPLYKYIEEEASVTSYAYSIKKVTGTKSLEKILQLIQSDKSVSKNLFIPYYTYYIHFIISLLVRGEFENKIEANDKMELLNIVKNAKISNLSNRSVKLSVMMIKINFSGYYLFWKLLKKDKYK